MSSGNCNTVAFEAEHLTYCEYKNIKEKVRAELVSTKDIIEQMRGVKSGEETRGSAIACEIASRAFDKILKDIRVGVTEEKLASKLPHY